MAGLITVDSVIERLREDRAHEDRVVAAPEAAPAVAR